MLNLLFNLIAYGDQSENSYLVRSYLNRWNVIIIFSRQYHWFLWAQTILESWEDYWLQIIYLLEIQCKRNWNMKKILLSFIQYSQSIPKIILLLAITSPMYSSFSLNPLKSLQNYFFSCSDYCLCAAFLIKTKSDCYQWSKWI